MQCTLNGNRLYQIIGLTKIPRRYRMWKFVTASYICFLAVTSLGVADVAGRFYGGSVSTAKFLTASYNKTVDNTAPNNMSTQKGEINRAESNDAESVNGFGDLLGYRISFGENGPFLSGEFDFVIYTGKRASGHIHEQGSAEDPNQLGESWYEDWNFEREISYGLTLKLGGSPGALRSWKTSVYALAGGRLAPSQFQAYYSGCFKPEPCVVGEYDSGALAKDRSLAGWTAGVGVEKMVHGTIALQVEGRYTSYKTEKWVTSFPDLGVEVKSELANHGVSLWAIVKGEIH